MTPSQPAPPKRLSTNAKLAFAAVAVTVIAVVWFATSGPEQQPSQPTAPIRPTMAPSDRVRQRLAQLRAAREGGAGRKVSDFFRGRGRDLTTPGIKGIQPSTLGHGER